MIFEKNSPGSLIVNKAGKRFMNEAAAYNDVVKNMYKANTPENPTIPAYFVFDKNLLSWFGTETRNNAKRRCPGINKRV